MRETTLIEIDKEVIIKCVNAETVEASTPGLSCEETATEGGPKNR